MGTGVPDFGLYTDPTPIGSQIRVWRINNATQPFPAGCTSIVLSPTTMGVNSWKMAMATLLAARTSSRPVRFFSHAERDGGCGVDYVEMQG